MNTTESGMDYASLCNQGVWFITPNTSPASALYSIRGYIGNFSCGLIDNEFGILKRPDNSLTAADWTCGTCGVGIGLSANGGEGRLASQPYALRKDLTSFSQFGIGKINSTIVQLPADTFICLGDSIEIHAGSFASYLWSTGATTSSIWVVGSSVGTFEYYVNVVNNVSFPSSDTIEITVLPLPEATITDFNDVSCFGGTNGDATVTASNGTPGYTYAWSTSPTQTGTTASGLTAGIYYVTVTDSKSCFVKASATISEPPSSVDALIIKITDVTCFGGNNGSIIAGATGGVSPYDYEWNTMPPQLTFTATNLTAGIYTVTVTDNHGCTDTISATVSEPPLLDGMITSQTDVSCNGAATGEATVNATGGTPDYDYLWNTIPAQTAANATNLSAGIYEVIITDSLLCVDTISVTINENTAIVASIQSQIDVTCNAGTNGSATAEASGGSPGYTFEWSTTPVQTSQTAIDLSAETYTITATDINGCTGITTVTINEPTAVNAVITSQINSSCNGGTDGIAVVEATGGTPGYTYVWNTLPAQTNDTAINLAVGIYIVTVSDVNNCTDTAIVTIGQPSTLSVSVGTQTNVSCNGGSDGNATITVSGGEPGYTYLWSTAPTDTTDAVSGLSAGVYYVTVTDTLICSAIAMISITEPFILNLSISDSTNILCFGNADGTATIIANGGTWTYSYSWNTNPIQNTSVATGLIAGTYTAYVTDENACIDSVEVTLTEPSGLIAEITDSSNVICFGTNTGTATVSVSGGTTPYSYSWSGGTGTGNDTVTDLSANVSYYITVSDANGCFVIDSVTLSEPISITLQVQSINTTCGGANGSAWVITTGGTEPFTYIWSDNSTEDTIINLNTGIYSVTVTDSLGCFSSTSLTINDDGGPTLATTSTMVSCNGGNDGTATVTVSGGVTPYTFNWSGGAITDSSTATGLNSGTYTVTVMDANNCSSTADIIVSDPPAFIASIQSIQNISCFGYSDGSATVSVTGGTAPYSYSWSNGDTTNVADSLGFGGYVVIITDANGCTTSTTTTISQPPALTATISDSTNVLCFGQNTGTATLTASGGIFPYNYMWDNNPPSVNAIAYGLSAGVMYHVTVTDLNGCTANDSVMLNSPEILTVNQVTVNATCGLPNGSISLTPAGGVTPYSYTWQSYPDSTGSSLLNISSGTYNVTVSDANDCQNTLSISVTNTSSGILSLTTSNISCYGLQDGTLTAVLTGALPPYVYLWSNSETGSTISNLATGTYSVTVTDAAGCVLTGSQTIQEPAAVYLLFNVKNANCKGQPDGRITALPTGGTAPFSYLWNTGAQDSIVIGVATAYCVTVTDANGCNISGCDTIYEPDSAIVTVIAADSTNCFGGNDGKARITAYGGTLGFSYLWNTIPIQTSNQAVGLSTGLYIVTVTDMNLCHSIDSVRVFGPAAIYIDTLVTPTSCEEGDDGRILVHASGGHPPYLYHWYTDPAQNDTLAEGLYHGFYDVKITDSKGCFISFNIEVTNTLKPCLEIPNVFTPNADGVHDLWNIRNLHLYPKAIIEVYNRWGNLIYSGKPSDSRWDGKFNGVDCPSGSYVYIINLGDGTDPKNGVVTIVR